MSKFMKEAYNAHFTSHEEFLAEVEEMDSDTRWSQQLLGKVKYAPAESASPAEVIGGEPVLLDTVRTDIPIIALLPDGSKMAMRPYLWKNVKDLSGDNSKAVSRYITMGKIDRACAHLNFGLDSIPASKVALMMVRGQKISGWFGEFNASWGQKKQVDTLETELAKSFERMMFESGEMNHLFTAAKYKLDMDMKTFAGTMVKTYEEAWHEAGMDGDLSNAVPHLQFITGESGLTAISIRPYLDLGWSQIPLGGTLSTTHRGGDEVVWDKFASSLASVGALYTKSLDDMAKLCKYRVSHPYNCLSRVMKNFLPCLPMSACRDDLSDFECYYPRKGAGSEKTCSAMEIVSHVVSLCNANNIDNPRNRFRNMELIAQLYKANWNAFDTATAAHWIMEKSGMEKSGVESEEE